MTPELILVIRKCIGPIYPRGEAHWDAKKLANMQELITLVNTLLADIAEVANHPASQLASVNAAVKHAKDFLSDIK